AATPRTSCQTPSPATAASSLVSTGSRWRFVMRSASSTRMKEFRPQTARRRSLRRLRATIRANTSSIPGRSARTPSRSSMKGVFSRGHSQTRRRCGTRLAMLPGSSSRLACDRRDGAYLAVVVTRRLGGQGPASAAGSTLRGTRMKAEKQLEKLLAERIAVLDGAWGVLIHRRGFSEEEYRGERFREHARDLQGDPDLLNLTKPHVVA